MLKGRESPISEGSSRPTRPALYVTVLLTVWLAGALYGWHYLDRGWFPNNAGAFALSAERVLNGEVPHRDFDEIYTGGADYLHALTFKVLGTNMAAMRRALFLVFLAWIPAVYYVATRFAPPFIAGLVTLLAVTWSIPFYSDPIASWYNLFFATHGTASLLRYFETGRRRWLFVVGVCAGLSLLAKIIGVYFLIAACLALLFHEQQRRRNTEDVEARPGSRPLAIAYCAALAIGLSTGAVALALIVGHWHGAAGVLHFAVPVAALAAVLVRNEIALPLRSAASRLREHARMLLPVAIGLVVAVGPFLAPYLLTGSLGALVKGLFVDPRQRLIVTTRPPPMMSWACVPLALMLVWVSRWSRLPALLLAAGLAVSAVLIALRDYSLSQFTALITALIESIRAIVPATVVSGSLALFLPRARDHSRSCLVFASIATAALCNLVQFPMAIGIYIIFVAPLGVLAMVAVFDCKESAARAPFVVVIVSYLVFSVYLINLSQQQQIEPLDIDRAGGIRVRAAEKQQYEALVKVVRTHGKGEYIYATPDCPEVYFLSGFRNPTRTTYDFFDDPTGRVERIEDALARTGVSVVVLNQRPQFSAPPPPELLNRLVQAYPQSMTVGKFEVRWRP